MKRLILASAWFSIIGVSLVSAHLFAWPQYVRWSNNRDGQHYSGCHVCGDKFSWKAAHCVQVTESTGSFLLCEDCWDVMTPTERADLYVKDAEQLARDMPRYFENRRLRPLDEPTMLIDEFDNWEEYIKQVRRSVMEDREGYRMKPFLEEKVVFVNRC